jgi:hypothetical protein
MTIQFNRLNDALNAVITQGAKRIGALNAYGLPSFSFERTALTTVEKAPATCTLFLNSKGKWTLSDWFIGTGGHIDFQPSPERALGRAIAEYYFSDQPRFENPPLPRTLETDKLQQFHFESETGCYKAVSGGRTIDINEVLGFFLLSPKEQESSPLSNFRVKFWIGDSSPINWDEFLYTPNDIDCRICFDTPQRVATYSAHITYDGEIEIDSAFGKAQWVSGSRLTPEEVNQISSKIYVESSAYSPAIELGLKVTHREDAPDCGTYTDISDW